MLANPAHSHPTRKLSRQVGTLSSALTASILRESSRRHRYTLSSIQIPYSEVMPGKSLAYFHSFRRAKQAIHDNSFPILIRKPGRELTRMLQPRLPSESYSDTTRIISI